METITSEQLIACATESSFPQGILDTVDSVDIIDSVDIVDIIDNVDIIDSVIADSADIRQYR